MSQPYARGKRAFGFCDRCERRTPLDDLQYQIFAQKNTYWKVCPECMDVDHPQLLLGRTPVNDPIALYQPRPDLSKQQSRDLTSWNPVAANTPPAVGAVGVIRVTLT